MKVSPEPTRRLEPNFVEDTDEIDETTGALEGAAWS
jgi:hypothetical protein